MIPGSAGKESGSIGSDGNSGGVLAARPSAVEAKSNIEEVVLSSLQYEEENADRSLLFIPDGFYDRPLPGNGNDLKLCLECWTYKKKKAFSQNEHQMFNGLCKLCKTAVIEDIETEEQVALARRRFQQFAEEGVIEENLRSYNKDLNEKLAKCIDVAELCLLLCETDPSIINSFNVSTAYRCLLMHPELELQDPKVTNTFYWLQDAALRTMINFGPKELVLTVHAFAAMQHRPCDELLKVMDHRTAVIAGQMNQKEIVMISRAFAMIGWEHCVDSIWLNLSQEASDQLEKQMKAFADDFTSKQIAHFLWVLASLHSSRLIVLFDLLEPRLIEGCGSKREEICFSAQEVAIILCALAQASKMRKGGGGSNERLLSFLEQRLEKVSADLTCQEIAYALMALSAIIGPTTKESVPSTRMMGLVNRADFLASDVGFSSHIMAIMRVACKTLRLTIHSIHLPSIATEPHDSPLLPIEAKNSLLLSSKLSDYRDDNSVSAASTKKASSSITSSERDDHAKLDPAISRHPASGSPATIPDRYKTTLCLHLQTNETCEHGIACHCAHGRNDLRHHAKATKGNMHSNAVLKETRASSIRLEALSETGPDVTGQNSDDDLTDSAPSEEWFTEPWACLQEMRQVRAILQSSSESSMHAFQSLLQEENIIIRDNDVKRLVVTWMSGFIARRIMIPPRKAFPTQNSQESMSPGEAEVFSRESNGAKLWLCKQFNNALAEYWAKLESIRRDARYKLMEATIAMSTHQKTSKSQGLILDYVASKYSDSSADLDSGAEIVDFSWLNPEEHVQSDSARVEGTAGEHLLEYNGKLSISQYDYFEAGRKSKADIRSLKVGDKCAVLHQSHWKSATIQHPLPRCSCPSKNRARDHCHKCRSTKLVLFNNGVTEEIPFEDWRNKVRACMPNLRLYGPKIDFPLFDTDENITKFKEALAEAANVQLGDVDVHNVHTGSVDLESHALVSSDDVKISSLEEGYQTVDSREKSVVVVSTIRTVEIADLKKVMQHLTATTLTRSLSKHHLIPQSSFEVSIGEFFVTVHVEMPIHLCVEMRSFGFVGDVLHALESILLHKNAETHSVSHSIAIPKTRQSLTEAGMFRNLHENCLSLRLTVKRDFQDISKSLTSLEDFRMECKLSLAGELRISADRVKIARVSGAEITSSTVVNLHLQCRKRRLDTLRGVDALREAIQNRSDLQEQVFDGNDSSLNQDQLEAIID